MDIIDELLGPVDFTTEELAIIKRIVHTTGDPNYASLVKIHPEAIERGIEALKGGASIFTDVKMIQAGINSRVLGEFGGEVYCDISSPAISEEAKRTGLTRALTARSGGKKIDGSIVAIGNAPTALFEVLRLAEEENIRPALVVGIPVGFVGAVNLKSLVNSISYQFQEQRWQYHYCSNP